MNNFLLLQVKNKITPNSLAVRAKFYSRLILVERLSEKCQFSNIWKWFLRPGWIPVMSCTRSWLNGKAFLSGTKIRCSFTRACTNSMFKKIVLCLTWSLCYSCVFNKNTGLELIFVNLSALPSKKKKWKIFLPETKQTLTLLRTEDKQSHQQQ